MRTPFAIGAALVLSAAMAAPAAAGCPTVSGTLDADIVSLPVDGQPLQVNLIGTVGPAASDQSYALVISGADGAGPVVATRAVRPDQSAVVTGPIAWLPGSDQVGGYELRALPADGSTACTQVVSRLSAQDIWGRVIAEVDSADAQFAALE